MPNNRDDMKEARNILAQSLASIRADRQTWGDFLRFSGKYYKYKFAAQAMMFHQNPKGEAMATAAIWQRIHRDLAPTAKGYLIFDNDNYNEAVKIFDVRDTLANENSLGLGRWAVAPDEVAPLLASLGADSIQSWVSTQLNTVTNLSQTWKSAISAMIMARIGIEVPDSLIAPSFEAIRIFSPTDVISMCGEMQKHTFNLMGRIPAALKQMRSFAVESVTKVESSEVSQIVDTPIPAEEISEPAPEPRGIGLSDSVIMNGKTYEIYSIGMFDAELRDLQTNKVFTISIERLNSLLEKMENPETENGEPAAPAVVEPMPETIIPEKPRISEKEIKAVICRGSGISEGKLRIYDHYISAGTDNIAFLKNEYGWGGAYPAATVDGVHLDEMHDGKGIKISKGSVTEPTATVLLPWKKVDGLISVLIQNGEYLSEKEMNYYPEFLAKRRARQERQSLTAEIRDFIREVNDFENAAQVPQENRLVSYYTVDSWLRDYGAIGQEEIKQNIVQFLEKVASDDRFGDRAQILLYMLEPGYVASAPEITAEPTKYVSYDILCVDVEKAPGAFLSRERAEKFGPVNIHNYELKYSGDVAEPMQGFDKTEVLLEALFQKFNIERPEDYTAHSLSVSDVIALHTDADTVDYYYTESIGYEKLPNSFTQELVVPEATEIQEEPKSTAEYIGLRGNTLYYYAPVSLSIDTDFSKLPTPDNGQRMVVAAPVCYMAADFLSEHHITFLKIGRDIEESQLAGQSPTAQITAMELAENAFCTPEGNTYHVGDYIRNEEDNSVIIISNVDADTVYYSTPEMEEKELTLGSRAEFDAHMDDGLLHIIADPEQPFIKGFYVIEDLDARKQLAIQRFDDMDEALKAYFSLPNDKVKAFGIEKKENPMPGSIDFLQCVNGIDCVTSDYLKVDEWNNPEIISAIEKIDMAIDLHDTQAAYKLDSLFLTIHHTDKGFDYTLYDREHHLTDGGVLENPGLTITEAINDLLKETGYTFADCEVINYENFMELVDQIPPLPVKESPPVLTVDIAPQNYILKDDHIGEGSASARLQANINAITVLKSLETAGKTATAEDQDVLAKYVGWGGLSNVFEESNAHYQELRTLLDPGEYQSAKASVTDAFYTSPAVIRPMYDILERLGFHGGNVLEPSMGIGNFLGCMPASMAAASMLHGVELDSISGRIAKLLYPNADITIGGYQEQRGTDLYDLAIGNVPFGDFRIHDVDPKINRLKLSIHNHFFAKAISQVRPGGIIAFVTSRYTMDAKDPKARLYMAQRAQLLGAIRLPNNAFLAAAGTEAVTDIIFLQRRAEVVQNPDEAWIDLDTTEDGIQINEYFVAHPEMICGTLKMVSGRFGPVPTVEPSQIPLEEQIREAGMHIEGSYLPAAPKLDEPKEAVSTLPFDPDLRPYSITVRNGAIYFQESGDMKKLEDSKQTEVNIARVRQLEQIRDTLRSIIELQADPITTDEELDVLRKNLNALYDEFVSDHGRICSPKSRIFRDDSAYPLLRSLENLDKDGNFKEKAAIFTRRTVNPFIPITHVDSAQDALKVSMGVYGRVDLPYMSELSGIAPDKLELELQGLIYRDITCAYTPQSASLDNYPLVTADEYLSGNIREKIRMAKLLQPALNKTERLIAEENIRALENVMPEPLKAEDITARIGSTWIPESDYRDFILEVIQPPSWMRSWLKVKYEPTTCVWSVEGRISSFAQDINGTVTFGTSRRNAYEIVQDSLNLKIVEIRDRQEDGSYVLNTTETMLAQQKQNILQERFKDWLWENPQRRERLTTLYNEKYNSSRTREYDGSNLIFPGMNPEIELRDHQKNAIAHILYGKNTLLAHCVGAGKTYEMMASIVEAKRLGLCHKAMLTVPNHLTEQMGSDFMKLYPGANILVATKQDLEADRRKMFWGRVAAGDYDCIIIAHSQFKKVPISAARQQQWINEEIDRLEDSIREMQYKRAGTWSVKQLEGAKKRLEARLKKLLDTTQKDDTITFEELGIDRLYVDEAHAFKNCAVYTKMNNVSGLSTSESQQAEDMLLKCRYLDEITGGRGVVFATGTPLTKTIVEMYIYQRYLQADRLKELGLDIFDSWASVFGEQTSSMELKPEGNGYRTRTRFSKFFNLPELVSLFKETADIKVQDQLNLPIPHAETHIITAKPSDFQKKYVEEIGERAEKIHNGAVSSDVDNMLKLTLDGKKLGLDQRLIDPLLPDYEGSKVNLCLQNVLKHYREGMEEKLTQLVFCDMSTPKNGKEKSENGFSVYDDLKEKLVANGVPESEIAFIHDADTDKKKDALFAKVREGTVRILIGSTQKMGAGTNVQDRIIASHDLDAPWNPSDLEQRAGRTIRQGNRNSNVHIYRYVTEGTFDAYIWQTLEIKQRIISQIMTSKEPVRVTEDTDDVLLSYAATKAACTSNPLIRERMELENEISKLKILKASYRSEKFGLQYQVNTAIPNDIKATESLIEGLNADLKLLKDNPETDDSFHIEILHTPYFDKKTGAAALMDIAQRKQTMEPEIIGKYRGFQLELRIFMGDHEINLRGATTHNIVMGKSGEGNLIRITNAFERIPERILKAQARLDDLKLQLEKAKEQADEPWPEEENYMKKLERLHEIDFQMANEAEIERQKKKEEKEKEEELDEDWEYKFADPDSNSCEFYDCSR